LKKIIFWARESADYSRCKREVAISLPLTSACRYHLLTAAISLVLLRRCRRRIFVSSGLGASREAVGRHSTAALLCFRRLNPDNKRNMIKISRNIKCTYTEGYCTTNLST